MQVDDGPGVAVDDADKELASLGGTLRAAREARNLQLEHVAAELRIDSYLLRALEEERFDLIGPPVFARGYIKQYGNCLHLDTAELLRAYERLARPDDVKIQPSRTIRLRDERRIAGWIVAGLVSAALIAFLVVWWLNDSSNVAPPPAAVPSRAVTGDRPAASLEAIEAPAAADEAAASPETDPAATRPEPGNPVAAPAEPVADPVAEPSGVAADVSADVSADGRPLADGPAMSLEVVFIEDSWADITDARGQRLFYRLGVAGERVRLSGVAPITVFLGYSDGVSLRVNGQDYPVPRSRRGDIVRFTLESAAD